jgi:hypothetical protein
MIWWILIILLVVLVTLALIIALVLRPRSHRWGATGAEVRGGLPGDELVPDSKQGYTQAITIDAPPANVWPWVVQIGYGRAGWYTYDWVYALLGGRNFYDGKHSAKRIIPELQDLQVGDQLKIAETMPFDVAILEPNHVLGLVARVDWATNEPYDLDAPLPEKYMNSGWVYVLQPLGDSQTRLFARWRASYSPSLAMTLTLGIPIDAGAMLMQPKMLKGIKARAEQGE